MRSHYFILGVPLICMIFWSCDHEKDICNPAIVDPGLSVRLWMETDTIEFLPGDSAIVDGQVIVKGSAGMPYSGVPVDIDLTEPFGFIEYTSSLRDTTNDSGRVDFRFRSYNQTGTQRIRASAGGHSDWWQLVVLQLPRPDIGIPEALIPDTL